MRKFCPKVCLTLDITALFCYNYNVICACGETGRHDRFRFYCLRRAGSSPVRRTSRVPLRAFCVPRCFFYLRQYRRRAVCLQKYKKSHAKPHGSFVYSSENAIVSSLNIPLVMYCIPIVSTANISPIITVNLDRRIPQRFPAGTSHIFGTL